MREGPTIRKSLDFSILIVTYYETLENRRKFIIG
jgi:hypothetical protein